MGRRCPLEDRKAPHPLIKVFQQSGETDCYAQDRLKCVLTLMSALGGGDTLCHSMVNAMLVNPPFSIPTSSKFKALYFFSTTCQKRAPITPLTASVDSNNSAYGRSCLTDKFDDDRLPLFQLNKQIRISVKKTKNNLI